jgi:hypothetical protein
MAAFGIQAQSEISLTYFRVTKGVVFRPSVG